MTDIYLLTLSEPLGDTYLYYTNNHETYNWVLSLDNKLPLSMIKDMRKHNWDEVLDSYLHFLEDDDEKIEDLSDNDLNEAIIRALGDFFSADDKAQIASFACLKIDTAKGVATSTQNFWAEHPDYVLVNEFQGVYI